MGIDPDLLGQVVDHLATRLFHDRVIAPDRNVEGMLHAREIQASVEPRAILVMNDQSVQELALRFNVPDSAFDAANGVRRALTSAVTFGLTDVRGFGVSTNVHQSPVFEHGLAHGVDQLRGLLLSQRRGGLEEIGYAHFNIFQKFRGRSLSGSR